jgi:hypothetical protein
MTGHNQVLRHVITIFPRRNIPNYRVPWPRVESELEARFGRGTGLARSFPSCRYDYMRRNLQARNGTFAVRPALRGTK